MWVGKNHFLSIKPLQRITPTKPGGPRIPTKHELTRALMRQGERLHHRAHVQSLDLPAPKHSAYNAKELRDMRVKFFRENPPEKIGQNDLVKLQEAMAQEDTYVMSDTRRTIGDIRNAAERHMMEAQEIWSNMIPGNNEPYLAREGMPSAETLMYHDVRDGVMNSPNSPQITIKTPSVMERQAIIEGSLPQVEILPIQETIAENRILIGESNDILPRNMMPMQFERLSQDIESNVRTMNSSTLTKSSRYGNLGRSRSFNGPIRTERNTYSKALRADTRPTMQMSETSFAPEGNPASTIEDVNHPIARYIPRQEISHSNISTPGDMGVPDWVMYENMTEEEYRAYMDEMHPQFETESEAGYGDTASESTTESYEGYMFRYQNDEMIRYGTEEMNAKLTYEETPTVNNFKAGVAGGIGFAIGLTASEILRKTTEGRQERIIWKPEPIVETREQTPLHGVL